MYECISWNNVHISVRNSSVMYFHLYTTVSSKYSIVRVCIYLIKVWRTFGDNIHMRISLKRPITNRVSKVIRKWNGFALVRSHSVNYSYFLIGSENSRLPQARPIRCNTKTNYDLVTRPSRACFYPKLSFGFLWYFTFVLIGHGIFSVLRQTPFNRKILFTYPNKLKSSPFVDLKVIKSLPLYSVKNPVTKKEARVHTL